MAKSAFVSQLIHRVIASRCRNDYLQFMAGSEAVEQIQRSKLAGYLSVAYPWTPRSDRPVTSYEDFREIFPITNYSDYEKSIEKERILRRTRFEPTSGSTSKRKWIPYTTALISEFEHAASTWLYDSSLRHPEILKGSHYWSLSWLPNDLRSELESIDDLQVFEGLKRAAMDWVMAVPAGVSTLAQLEDSKVATLVYLASEAHLTMISVWSPTFLLAMLNDLAKHRLTIAEVLRVGVWPGESKSFGKLRAPRNKQVAKIIQEWSGEISADFLRLLWPKLILVSAWDSSTSAIWAAELQRLFPDCEFQGKGLWATEACFTVPIHGMKPLAINCHFYEFRDLETGAIAPAWQLELGQKVLPIVTTGGGFCRYEIQDVMRVTGFLNQAPCFEFEGRLHSVDLVGEKLDSEIAREILKKVEKLGVRPISLIARAKFNQPHYMLLAQGSESVSEVVSLQIERLLQEVHHYRLARELGQLSPARAHVAPNALEFYQKIVEGSRKISGGAKVEALMLWNS